MNIIQQSWDVGEVIVENTNENAWCQSKITQTTSPQMLSVIVRNMLSNHRNQGEENPLQTSQNLMTSQVTRMRSLVREGMHMTHNFYQCLLSTQEGTA